ncbi:hypothetical protein [Rhizobium laguerreae]|uniref:hypothetical protein n=1 Tax=Rhizobium laguerreae TaxID=1076926 RepID=UPI00300899F9
MSTDDVKREIGLFLASEDSEVLCIRGNWGTGKTYSWRNKLADASKDIKTLKRDRYSYVSLFGLNSLDELKRDLFHNTVGRSSIGKEFDADDVKSVYEGVRELTKAGSGVLGRLLPAGLGEASASLAYLTIRNQLICIDDLERKGKNLRSIDVLGFISQLKEDRACKIVLLLNDEQLEDRKEFYSYLEKVVDLNLHFAPSAEESADIALKDVKGHENIKPLVLERVKQLGIDNIRVIRKVFRLIVQIEPLLKGFKPEVLRDVASSIILFGWSVYQPEIAPPLPFLKDKRTFFPTKEKDAENAEPKELAWKALLEDYGYRYTDDFDLVLMQGVWDGYFNQKSINSHAAELNERAAAAEAQNELRSAWQSHYHYTFTNNRDDVLNALYACFMKSVRFYSANDLHSAVKLFRKLDDPKRAQEMIDAFVVAKKDMKGAFDLSNLYITREDELEQDVAEAMQAAENAQAPDYTADELFLRLASEGYDADTTTRLAAVPVKDYIRVLRSYNGDKLSLIMKGLAQWMGLVNPTDAINTIMDKAGEALLDIAKDSPLNAMRARRWGLIDRFETRAAEKPKDEEWQSDQVAKPTETSRP